MVTSVLTVEPPGAELGSTWTTPFATAAESAVVRSWKWVPSVGVLPGTTNKRAGYSRSSSRSRRSQVRGLTLQGMRFRSCEKRSDFNQSRVNQDIRQLL